VLARILEERGLTKTNLGTTALACAATNDVAAWTVLAVVVAIVKSGRLASTVLSIALAGLFVAVVLFWIKPRIPRWLGHAALEASAPGGGVMAAAVSSCSPAPSSRM